MFGNLGLPRWELTGAGVTSSTCSALMFLALLAHAQWDRRFRRYHIFARFWRTDWPRFFELVRVGIPIGLTIVAASGLFSAAALLIGIIGTAPLAAHAVPLQCAAVAYRVRLGIALAVGKR